MPKKKRKKIYLETKVCRKSMYPKCCSQCKRKVAPIWSYKKSNVGPVRLCMQCRPNILDRSFGKIDALNRSKHYGHFNSREAAKKI